MTLTGSPPPCFVTRLARNLPAADQCACTVPHLPALRQLDEQQLQVSETHDSSLGVLGPVNFPQPNLLQRMLGVTVIWKKRKCNFGHHWGQKDEQMEPPCSLVLLCTGGVLSPQSSGEHS